MFHRLAALSLAAVLLAAAGCAESSPGRGMMMGDVDPQLAFTTARDVMGQYYDVDPAGTSAETGVIKCLPKPVDDYQERLLGASPTRHVARLQIVRAEGQTQARVCVEIQQLGSAAFRAAVNEGSYSGVPNESPGQAEAATTPEQNQTWKTVGYAYSTERKVLDDLYRRLHPEAATQP